MPAAPARIAPLLAAVVLAFTGPRPAYAVAGGSSTKAQLVRDLRDAVNRLAKDQDAQWFDGGEPHDTVIGLTLDVTLGGWSDGFLELIDDRPAWVVGVQAARRLAVLVASRYQLYSEPSGDRTYESDHILGKVLHFLNTKVPAHLRARREIQLLIQSLENRRDFYSECENGVPRHAGACGDGNASD